MRTKFTAMDGEGTASPGVLEIRVAEGPADWVIAHQMLDDEHLLGAGREARLNLSTKTRTENSLPTNTVRKCKADQALREEPCPAPNLVAKPAAQGACKDVRVAVAPHKALLEDAQSTKIYLLRKQAMKSGTSNLKGLLAACRT